MTDQDDITFLETFRANIERFLILGAAPTEDPLWGGKALTKMKEALKDPEFRDLRRDINRMKGRATEILEGLGIGCTFEQYPPPAVGGPVVKLPLFDLITDNQSLHTIDGAAFTDKIDEAIGLLRNAATIGPASPFFIVSDLVRSLDFYQRMLGFDCRYKTPEDEPFFAIVGRGSAQFLFKAVDIAPQPNPVQHEGAAWDAFVHTSDPDALAAEISDRGVTFHTPLANTEDGLRGFAVADPDGYVLFFGRPV